MECPASADGCKPRGRGWCTCRVAGSAIVTWGPATNGSRGILAKGLSVLLICGSMPMFLGRSEAMVPLDLCA